MQSFFNRAFKAAFYAMGIAPSIEGMKFVRNASQDRNPVKNPMRRRGKYVPAGTGQNCGARGISPKSFERANPSTASGRRTSPRVAADKRQAGYDKMLGVKRGKGRAN